MFFLHEMIIIFLLLMWEIIQIDFQILTSLCIPHSSLGKESACNAGDLGSIPGLGRSPGEGKGYTLQYYGLENSMDCIVHGVAKSRTGIRTLISLCILTIILHLVVVYCAFHILLDLSYDYFAEVFFASLNIGK